MKVKRENSDDGQHQDKRNRRNDDQVRILIPSNIAGAVIGKGGQHIQKMRSQYKATVSVDDCQGPERTILISSDLESTVKIITEMLKYFEERDDEVDVRLLIHQSLAGCVIGKGGQKIKEIRDKIGCRILKVFSNVAPQSTDRVVQTVGKQSQVLDAVREVITLTRETPIKGPAHNYDPINFDRMYAEEYGGYGTGGSQNPRQSRGGARGGNGGGGGGNGGRFGGGNDRSGSRRNDRSRSGGRGGRGGGDDRNNFVNPWANEDGSFGGGNNGGGFGGGNFGGGGFGGNAGGASGNFGGFGVGSGGFGGNGPAGNFGGSAGGFGGGSGGGIGGGFGNAGGFGGASQMGGGPSGGSGGFGGGNQGGNGGFGGNMNQVGGFGGGAGNMGNGLGAVTGGGANVFGPGPANNGPNGANLPVGHDPKNSTQVTIPKDLAGAIIGKGGGRIRRIRNESGAYITIDEPLPGSSDRIITISGSPKQIQMAQYLLQQSVHENNNSGGGGGGGGNNNSNNNNNRRNF